jgi:hypothetical protein
MGTANVGISQRGMIDASHALLVFRNFTQSADRYIAQFSVTAVDNLGVPISSIPAVSGLRHGLTFSMPAGSLLKVLVEQTDGENQGDTAILLLQPYVEVVPDYNIFHFYHEESTEVCWAIGSPAGDDSKVCVLRSTDYFSTAEERGSINLTLGDPNLGQYRSIYLDAFQNVIVGWRPGPLISRDGGYTFEQLFSWMDPDHGILCPFWNITEDDAGLLVISEYGDSLATTKPHGSHRGTFWSGDPPRRVWRTNVVDAGRDPNDLTKFSGYFRHIHGYHINPDLPHVHHMFLGDPESLGDPPKEQASDGTPGYYVSQDSGVTWSTEIIREWVGGDGDFYNGPCFVTWWPNGQAFITSDTARDGNAYWWGSGPVDWGGPGFDPVVELNADVDEESHWPDTPWMAMAVKGSYETYCTTRSDKGKEILWRYDADVPHIQVLAEGPNIGWLSGSRHNRIPAQAKYFFTSGNRRFPRI